MIKQKGKSSRARRGDEARDRRDWALAAEQYRLHLDLKPHDFGIWVQLGHALKESGRLAEALTAYNRGLALNDRDADLLLNMGHLYKVMNLSGVAKTYYLRSAEVDGNAAALDELRLMERSAMTPPSLASNHAQSRILDVVPAPVHPRTHERLDSNNPDFAAYEDELIRDSGLFDRAWYLKTYPDLREAGVDPKDALRHYLRHGAADGRNPHPLFDTNYYVQENADVIAAGMNPLFHYIKYGEKECRNPHPLFDVGFYLERNPDVGRNGAGSLRHFIEHGATEGRDPNPYFNTKWYLEQNPNILASEINPLIHYITTGEASGANPSPDFDIDWYLRCNLDVARAGMSPLYHFLRSGLKEGREPCRSHGLLGPVTDAEILCIKNPSFDKEVALFVAHSPHGRLKPHVRHYLKILNQGGIATILIVAADAPFSDIDAKLIRDMNGIFVRQNVGFDFAAWAHVLRLYPELLNADLLYLINDSVFGPMNETLFSEALKRVRASAADVLGLTDSFEFYWHIQSYFLAFKKRALSSDALRQFFESIVSFARKITVTAEYEVPLAGLLSASGLGCEVVFPQDGSVPINRTLFQWRSLVESGFPFIKVATIRDGHPEADTRGWREVLAAQGYDLALVERTLSEDRPPLNVTVPAPSTAKQLRLASPTEAPASQPEFDPEFYRAIYPDIAAAGVDPYDHYVNHGRAEGRYARAPEQLDVLDQFGSVARARETVLVVSHEGVRGGAPILAYNLVKGFLKKYNVIILFLSSGPLLEHCRDAGAAVIGPIGLAGSPELADFVIERITATTPIKFAIINTIASRYVLPALSKKYVPTVSLIHEFAAYIRPHSAFREAVYWSGQVVFSTAITLNNAVTEYPELAGGHYTIVPQGRCVVPDGGDSKGNMDLKGPTPARDLLRPHGFPADGVVVMGAGNVEYRKGVDLFLECAARVLRSASDIPCRFVWIGRGYNPDGDIGYSVYLADQITRSGIENYCYFLDEVSDLDAVYKAADILLLSSRLDPLPNVAIDALTMGLPVVCFADTTGIADILIENALGEHTVAPYLDIDSLAQKVDSLIRSKELRDQVAAKCREVANATFDANKYVLRIEEIATQQAERAKQEQLDVETIANSDLPQLDFYLSPNQPVRPRQEIVREYVRSWASGIGRRKLFPGFHPGIYREQHGLTNPIADPLADYIRAGRPSGPWAFPIIRQNDPWKPVPADLRIGLHIHAYYLEVFPEILERLTQNSVRPDLLISVKSEAARKKMQDMTASYKGGRVHIHLVPEPGRDVGPFLTEFGETIINNYDITGHLHTKISKDVANNSVGKIWTRFMLENVLGKKGMPMADIILSRMVESADIGLVFADDPHVVGWDKNKEFVSRYSKAFSLDDYPENLHFPVGAMFWARSKALKPMFDLGLTWRDYPVEPLPYDGSLLHGLERLYGLAARHAGFSIANTNIFGLTR